MNRSKIHKPTSAFAAKQFFVWNIVVHRNCNLQLLRLPGSDVSQSLRRSGIARSDRWENVLKGTKGDAQSAKFPFCNNQNMFQKPLPKLGFDVFLVLPMYVKIFKYLPNRKSKYSTTKCSAKSYHDIFCRFTLA